MNRDLLGVAGIYWDLRDPPGSTGICHDLLGTTGICRGLLGLWGVYWDLLGSKREGICLW